MTLGDGLTNGCLVEYNNFKDYYRMMIIDLSKQQALDVDQKSIQQINLTENLDLAESAKMFFIIEVSKETILDFVNLLLHTIFNINMIIKR